MKTPVMNLKLFPWDNDEKPYWINPENGLEWYVDKNTTECCSRDTLNDLQKLDAVVFLCRRECQWRNKPT